MDRDPQDAAGGDLAPSPDVDSRHVLRDVVMAVTGVAAALAVMLTSGEAEARET